MYLENFFDFFENYFLTIKKPRQTVFPIVEITARHGLITRLSHHYGCLNEHLFIKIEEGFIPTLFQYDLTYAI